MAEEKLGLTQWGTQFLLGSLRDFIDDGVETPGIAEALRNRRAAMLKFFIELARLNLPHRPAFAQLETVPPPFGIIFDLLDVTESETFEDHSEQLLALARWFAEAVAMNDHATAVVISRRMGMDP